ncbi:MAG: DUF4382 domain-containing protein [Woeseiaceae bacterium]|nr:DUF4382 domain-containing protein [Woeseiaceae bacterium]
MGKTTAARLVTGMFAAALLMTGCGGGGGDNPAAVPTATGFIHIAITDAPIDEVSVVNIQFAAVTLKPASGDEITIEFDPPKDIDLVTLSDGTTAELLPDTAVIAGRYNWLAFDVNAEFDNVFDSYAMIPGGQVELRVPSANGLRLVSGFTVTQDQTTNLVIDWDLRKALADPLGQPGLHLRSALRVTDMASFGTLRGSVDAALVMDASCTNDLAADTGNAVYLYQGMVAAPGDIGDATLEPYATASVSQNGAGDYVYEINFLPVGEYTAVFTCQASDDMSDTDDDIEFSASQTFTIEDGETSEVNF